MVLYSRALAINKFDITGQESNPQSANIHSAIITNKPNKRQPARKLLLTLFALIVVQFISYGQQEATTKDGKTILLYEDGKSLSADSVPLYNIKTLKISKLEIPKTNPQDIIINHIGYSLLYNETHKQANWVAYQLTKEETNKIVERTNKFILDPLVKTETANDKDYSGSGYDRGHLAPASDMGWSSTSMAESFYYSNISPQYPGFNRGIWKRLEELVRTWAIEIDTIYVVTGPVLTAGLPTIGANKVSVPSYFYKVILDYSKPNIKGIGFIMSNTGSSDPLQYYAVTIDSVEKFTGIDFFPLLPDDQENQIESTLSIKDWTWKSAKIESEIKDDNTSTSVQCKGTTKDAARCKNKTLNPSGYCYLHEGQQTNQSKTQTTTVKNKTRTTSVQCSGTTKSGTRCKHMTYSPNSRCYQHGGN